MTSRHLRFKVKGNREPQQVLEQRWNRMRTELREIAAEKSS